MSKKTAAIAAAKALAGLALWTIGGGFASRINACQDGMTMAAFIAATVALESAGLWIFTDARYQSGRWVGYWEGRRDEAREHTEFMMKVFAMTAPSKRPEPPPAEKAPN